MITEIPSWNWNSSLFFSDKRASVWKSSTTNQNRKKKNHTLYRNVLFTLQIRTSCLWLNAPTPPSTGAFSFGLLLPPTGHNHTRTRKKKKRQLCSRVQKHRSAASSSRWANRFEALMCACVSVCNPVRGDFTINIYVWQTDQWLLKRSRRDDDGNCFCVLIKYDHADKLQIHNCAYIQHVCARTCTYTYTHGKW